MSETESPAPSAPAPAAPPPASKPRVARRWASALAWTLAPIVLGLGLLWAALWWMLNDEHGTRWLLDAVPGVSVAAPSGSLIGNFAAERVEIALPGVAGDRIIITGLRWSGLALGWPQADTSWLRIQAERVQAERVDVQIAASDPNEPLLTRPHDLSLPVEVEVRALHVDALHAAAIGETPLRDLDASLSLGADGGTAHRLDDPRTDVRREPFGREVRANVFVAPRAKRFRRKGALARSLTRPRAAPPPPRRRRRRRSPALRHR